MAATYSMVGPGKASQVITVPTGSPVTVLLTQDDFLIQHLGVQNDGVTPSVTGDAVVVMNSADKLGNAIAMAPNATDGMKTYVPTGNIPPQLLMGWDVPPGPDGNFEVQMQAVGHGAKVQLVRKRT